MISKCSFNYKVLIMNDSFTSAEQKNTQIQDQSQQNTPKGIDKSQNQMISVQHNNTFARNSQNNSQRIHFNINPSHFQEAKQSQLDQLFGQINSTSKNENGIHICQMNSQLQQSFLSNNKTCDNELSYYQQEFAGKTYQEIQTQDDCCASNCLKRFLNINQNNYHPHILSMKSLFIKLKQHSAKSLQNLKLCISYFQIKLKQQIESIKSLDDLQVIFQSILQNQAIRQAVIINSLQANNIALKQSRKIFCNKIKQAYQQLLSICIKVKQKRQKREKYIEEQILQKIDKIQREMYEIITYLILNQKEKSFNPQVTTNKSKDQSQDKDKYLQIKCLMNKQNEYLKLISDFNAKMITYIISMFSKEEILIVNQIDEALHKYHKAQIICYGESLTNLMIQQETNVQLLCRQELADIIQQLIPKELYIYAHSKDKNTKLQDILLSFSSHLQNAIFLSTIQMNNQFILFRNQAIWKNTKKILQKPPNSIDYQFASNEKKPTSRIFPEFNFPSDTTVVAILTSSLYLHFQRGDDIASIKLAHLKISKKGRQVKVGYRKKGIGGYFGMKAQLGAIQFETNEQVDIFIEKINLGMRRLIFC